MNEKKIGLPGEVLAIKAWADFFCVPEKELWWYLYEEADLLWLSPEERANIRATIKVNPNMQLAGVDFQHFRDKIDVKVNNKDKKGRYYTRFCFELWEEPDGSYSFGKGKADYIAQVLAGCGRVDFYSKSDILGMVNRLRIHEGNSKLCQMINDPHGRKNGKLLLVVPGFLDYNMFKLWAQDGIIRMFRKVYLLIHNKRGLKACVLWIEISRKIFLICIKNKHVVLIRFVIQ